MSDDKTTEVNPVWLASATGSQIQEIIEQIEPFLIDKPQHHVLIACLSVAILLMDPNISPEELQEGVKGASHYLVMFLSGMDDGVELSKEKIN